MHALEKLELVSNLSKLREKLQDFVQFECFTGKPFMEAKPCRDACEVYPSMLVKEVKTHLQLLTQYLEDLYDGPEVADVVDGQLQVDVAEVPDAV